MVFPLSPHCTLGVLPLPVVTVTGADNLCGISWDWTKFPEVALKCCVRRRLHAALPTYSCVARKLKAFFARNVGLIIPAKTLLMGICRLLCFIAHSVLQAKPVLFSESFFGSAHPDIQRAHLSCVFCISLAQLLKRVFLLIANAYILLQQLNKSEKGGSLITQLNLCIAFKAFSPHNSKIMILIFLCLVAGKICCC